MQLKHLYCLAGLEIAVSSPAASRAKRRRADDRWHAGPVDCVFRHVLQVCVVHIFLSSFFIVDAKYYRLYLHYR